MFQRIFFTVALFILCIVSTNAQKISFLETHRIAVGKKANDKYAVRFVNINNGIKYDTVNKTYDATGRLISFQLNKKTDWEIASVFDSATLRTYGFKSKNGGTNLDANIKAADGRLLVYWWPFNEKEGDTIAAKKKNQFFKDNNFSIELEERTNLSIPYHCFHAGVLTIPFKYWPSRKNLNNVQTAVNAGVYVGYKWGHSKFVKLPNEQEYRKYVNGWSINLFGGFSKLDIDEKNSKEGSEFKGSVAAINTGFAVGYHYKNFSVFIPVGFDIPLSKAAKDWAFKGKPWVGFGAGFDIF